MTSISIPTTTSNNENSISDQHLNRRKSDLLQPDVKSIISSTFPSSSLQLNSTKFNADLEPTSVVDKNPPPSRNQPAVSFFETNFQSFNSTSLPSLMTDNEANETTGNDGEVWEILVGPQSIPTVYTEASPSSNSLSSLGCRGKVSSCGMDNVDEKMVDNSEIQSELEDQNQTIDAEHFNRENNTELSTCFSEHGYSPECLDEDELCKLQSPTGPLEEESIRTVSHFFPYRSQRHPNYPFPKTSPSSEALSEPLQTDPTSHADNVALNYDSRCALIDPPLVRETDTEGVSPLAVEVHDYCDSSCYYANMVEETQNVDSIYYDDSVASQVPSIEVVSSSLQKEISHFSEPKPKILSGPLSSSNRLIRISTWPRKRVVFSRLENRRSMNFNSPANSDYENFSYKRYSSPLKLPANMDAGRIERVHRKFSIGSSTSPTGGSYADVTAPKIRILDNSVQKCDDERLIHLPDSLPSDLEHFYNVLVAVLEEQRSLSGRPSRIEDMSPHQLFQEKFDLQKSLLYFEKVYDRPSDSSTRRIMKPLYDHYRNVRRLVRCAQRFERNKSTVPPQATLPSQFSLTPSLENMNLQQTDESASLCTVRPTNEDNTCSILHSEGCRLVFNDSEPTSSTLKPKISSVNNDTPSSDSTSDKSLKTSDNESPVISPTYKTSEYPLDPSISLHDFTDFSSTLPQEELLRCRMTLFSAKYKLQRILHDFEQKIRKATNQPPSKRDRDNRRAEYTKYRDLKQRLFAVDKLLESPDTPIEPLVSLAQAVGRCHRRKLDSETASSKHTSSSCRRRVSESSAREIQLIKQIKDNEASQSTHIV